MSTRKRVHNQTEQSPQQNGPITEKTDLAKPEWAVSNVVSTSMQETYYWDDVRGIQQYNTSGDHTGESLNGSQEQQTEEPDNDAAHGVCDKRDAENWIDFQEIFRTRDASIASKRPAQAR